MIPLLSNALGRGRHHAEVGLCPGCGRPVTGVDDRVRLRAESYAHKRCATYNVRRMSALGRDRAGRPLPRARRTPPAGTD